MNAFRTAFAASFFSSGFSPVRMSVFTTSLISCISVRLYLRQPSTRVSHHSRASRSSFPSQPAPAHFSSAQAPAPPAPTFARAAELQHPWLCTRGQRAARKKRPTEVRTVSA